MITLFAMLASLNGASIPRVAQGVWAPTDQSCEDQVQRLTISAEQLEWYEATGYLLLGKKIEHPAGFYARLEGMNSDSNAMFWRSTLVLWSPSAKRLQIEKLDDEGKSLTKIDYQRCA